MEIKSIMLSLTLGWKNKWNYSGNASRSEFLWNTLALTIVFFVVNFFAIIGIGLLSIAIPALPIRESVWIVMTATFLVLAVIFCGLLSRRLQDTGHNRWYGIALVCLSPLATIATILFTVILFPTIVDDGAVFAWGDLLEDWKVAFMFVFSTLIIIAYAYLLVRVVPLLFKKTTMGQTCQYDLDSSAPRVPLIAH